MEKRDDLVMLSEFEGQIARVLFPGIDIKHEWTPEGQALVQKQIKKLEEIFHARKITWRDIQTIVRIADNLLNSLEYEKIKKMGEEGYYTEILNRFNKENTNA